MFLKYLNISSATPEFLKFLSLKLDLLYWLVQSCVCMDRCWISVYVSHNFHIFWHRHDRFLYGNMIQNAMYISMTTSTCLLRWCVLGVFLRMELIRSRVNFIAVRYVLYFQSSYSWHISCWKFDRLYNQMNNQYELWCRYKVLFESWRTDTNKYSLLSSVVKLCFAESKALSIWIVDIY